MDTRSNGLAPLAHWLFRPTSSPHGSQPRGNLEGVCNNPSTRFDGASSAAKSMMGLTWSTRRWTGEACDGNFFFLPDEYPPRTDTMNEKEHITSKRLCPVHGREDGLH